MIRILIIILFCVGCNANINEAENYYPDSIKNNGIEDMFDTAKWLLYCTNISHRNDSGYLVDNTSSIVKLYDCEMRHSYLNIEEDTVIIGTRFYYDDTIVQIPVSNDLTRFISVKFINREPESFSINSFHLPYDLVMSDNREEHFINYMKNKKIGNDWLRNEVKVRSKKRHSSSE